MGFVFYLSLQINTKGSLIIYKNKKILKSIPIDIYQKYKPNSILKISSKEEDCITLIYQSRITNPNNVRYLTPSLTFRNGHQKCKVCGTGHSRMYPHSEIEPAILYQKYGLNSFPKVSSKEEDCLTFTYQPKFTNPSDVGYLNDFPTMDKMKVLYIPNDTYRISYNNSSKCYEGYPLPIFIQQEMDHRARQPRHWEASSSSLDRSDRSSSLPRPYFGAPFSLRRRSVDPLKLNVEKPRGYLLVFSLDLDLYLVMLCFDTFPLFP